MELPRRYRTLATLVRRAPAPVRKAVANRAVTVLMRAHGYRRKPTVRQRITRRWYVARYRYAYGEATPRRWFALYLRAVAFGHTCKPWRYVTAGEHGQAYGGPEEGGWWFSTWEPITTHRVPVWRAKAALKALEATGSVRPTGYTFQPAAADTDPMADYTESDLYGATWHGGDVSCRVTTTRPLPEPHTRPYYC